MAMISSSTVSIRFHGVGIDPQNLTQLLGCSPTSAAKTGEKLTKLNGEIRTVGKGFWLLSYGEIDDIEVEQKIDLLLGKLTNNLEVWRMITETYKADMFFGLFLDGINEGFELSPSAIKKLSDRNLKIVFDIYSPTSSP